MMIVSINVIVIIITYCIALDISDIEDVGWLTTMIVNYNNDILYTGNIWRRKILVNCTGKSYWRGKIWWISYSQCICQIHFGVRICEYWWGKFWQLPHNLPNSPIFLCQIFPVYGNIIYTVETVLWTPWDQSYYQNDLISLVSLYDETPFGIITKCVDYAGVTIY